MGYDIRELIIRSSSPSRDDQMEVPSDGKIQKKEVEIYVLRAYQEKKKKKKKGRPAAAS